MTLLNTFVTKTETLEQSLALIQQQDIPDFFTKEFLKELGFVPPNSVHYVSLFKGLGLIDEELQPVLKHYRPFAESVDRARVVIADRMKEAYAPVFEAEAYADKVPEGQVYDLFKKVMGPEKSYTFVHLVADTFVALADYADWKTTTDPLPKTKLNEKEKEQQQSNKEKSTELHAVVVENTPHNEFITELMNGNSEHQYEPVVAKNGNGNDPYHEIHPGIIEQSWFDKKSNGADSSLTPHEEFILELMNCSSDHEYRTEITSLAEKHNEEIVRLNNVNKEAPEQSLSPSGAVGGGNHLSKEKWTDDDQQLITEKTLLIKDALFKRAELLIKLHQYDAAVGAYDDILLFATSNDRSVEHEKIVEVMYRKAAVLEQTAKYEEAIAAYDQLIALE